MFLTSTDGRLVIWAQQIAPPAPAGGSVNLATPYRVQVSYRSPGQSSSFNSTFGITQEAGLTLLGALQRTGSGLQALAREAVAALLNVPLGTAKTRIRDGLIRLRDTLGVSS